MDCRGNILESLVYPPILVLPDLAKQTDLQGHDATAFCNDERRRTRLPPYGTVLYCQFVLTVTFPTSRPQDEHYWPRQRWHRHAASLIN
jgi:hypothetical protein